MVVGLLTITDRDIWRELVHGFLPQTSNPRSAPAGDVRKRIGRSTIGNHVIIHGWIGGVPNGRRLRNTKETSLAREVLVIEGDGDEKNSLFVWHTTGEN